LIESVVQLLDDLVISITMAENAAILEDFHRKHIPHPHQALSVGRCNREALLRIPPYTIAIVI
jgi:hypothetical protein